MKSLDILLLEPEGGPRVSGRILEDLAFDNIGRAVFPDQSGLYEDFRDTLIRISVDAGAVRERQAIFGDFCAYPHLADDLISLSARAEEYRSAEKYRIYNKLPIKQKLREYLAGTVALLGVFDELSALLGRHNFKSRTLRDCRITSSAALISELRAVGRIIDTRDKEKDVDFMRINVSYGGGYKLKSALLVDAEKVTAESYYNRKERRTVVLDENFFTFAGASMAQFIADDIKKATLQNLCSVVSQISANVLAFFRDLKKSASFYKAALTLASWIDNNRLARCMPEISDDRAVGIEASGVYDLALAACLGGNPVTASDFDCRDGKIGVVTGLNQGGKTTFLRSIGIAQLLAQSGLFVPASEYRCNCFSGILTHFPSEEDGGLDYGKLAEELTRLRSDFPLLAGGGLALLNESFASTTAREGAEIASEVLRAAAKTDSAVIFVTHLWELATNLNTLNTKLPNGSRSFSLITETHGTRTPTYRIIKGPPLENIHTAELLE